MSPIDDDDTTEVLFDGVAEETRMVKIKDISQPSSPGPSGRVKIDPLPKGIKASLKALEGPQSGKVFNIEKPMVIIGRVADVADIVLPGHAVSRHHASINYQGGKFHIFDLGSTNGTQLDGQSVEQAELENGAHITIGDNIFEFSIA
jgi:hypothetical protein